MEEENTPVAHEGETYDAQEDRSSNNGNGSTTSHSSEEFVKVNQDDAPIDEGAGDVTHNDVEEVAPAVGSPSGLEKKLIDKLDPRVVDLLYWRDIKKTAFVFSFLLLILGSLVYFSVISVFAYAGLAFLTVTVAFRLYKLVLQTLNGTQQPHPFQDLLDHDVALSQEHFQKYTNAILSHLNCTITAARNLFLVQNTITSLKFGVFLWLLTYIGCCFNGLTILIIGIILAFTVPPIYEKYQTQIDNYYGMAREKALALIAAAKSKFPGAKQAKEKAQ